jgi:citrate synthase
MENDYTKGLRGVVAAETTVGDVRGTEGFFHYRQYDATDLARHCSLEEVAFLLLEGDLPDGAERAAFAAEVDAARPLPDHVAAALPALARAGDTLDAYRAAVALLGGPPLMDLTPAERRAGAVALIARTPVLLAALHRLARGVDPVDWVPGRPWAEGYLRAVTGATPSPAHTRALDAYLVATVDHGFNASTFTARVVASTGASLTAAVGAAVGALAGPRHGGAPSRALELLDEIGEPATVEAVDRVVRAKLAAGERIMGFGHAVYRTEDPRARLLRGIALDLGDPLAARAMVVERRVLELLAAHRPGRVLPANVELYAGVVMAACGVPADMFTPTFTASRVIGWCAHALEQAAEGTIIRPAARYTGPPAPEPLPAPRSSAA